MSAKGQEVLNRINSFRAIFKDAPLTIDNKQAIREYIDIQLSPENLSCDGEASAAHIRRVRADMQALEEYVFGSTPESNGYTPPRVGVIYKAGEFVEFRNKTYRILKVNKVNYRLEDETGAQFNLRIGAPLKLVR